jgi:hypothetical protein
MDIRLVRYNHYTLPAVLLTLYFGKDYWPSGISLLGISECVYVVFKLQLHLHLVVIQLRVKVRYPNVPIARAS